MAWIPLVLVALAGVLGVAERIVLGPYKDRAPVETAGGQPKAGPRRTAGPGTGGPAGPPPKRNPHAWQDDQIAFRRRYAEDPDQFDRIDVAFRWWTRPEGPTYGLIGSLWLVGFLFRLARNTTPGTLVALYHPEAEPGSQPFLCFEVFDDAFGGVTSGEGEGLLVGEAVTNGTLLLEVDGRPVIPRWNPNTEVRDAPGR